MYEADLRGTDPLTTLAERVALGEPPIRDYTVALVEGTASKLAIIDRLLGQYAHGWTVGRMPDVDRAVLRLASYELLWRADVPAAVVIDEAVELVRQLSTDESPAFVNGVLAQLNRDRPPTEQIGTPVDQRVPPACDTVAIE